MITREHIAYILALLGSASITLYQAYHLVPQNSSRV